MVDENAVGAAAIQEEMKVTLARTQQIVSQIEEQLVEQDLPAKPARPPAPQQAKKQGYRFGDFTRAAISTVASATSTAATAVGKYWSGSSEVQRSEDFDEDRILVDYQMVELSRHLEQHASIPTDDSDLIDASELFNIPSGVQIYEVYPSGKVVSCLVDDQPLACYFGDGTTFLQSGPWLCPLVQVSYCLKSTSTH